MTNKKVWINSLFKTYTIDSDVKIYFENKESLKNSESVLNLSIHPIRFADDVFLSFETNNIGLKNRIKKYEVNYDKFYCYADIITSHYDKCRKKNTIGENSLLIVGQTQYDKVLFNGNKYLGLIDFIDEIYLFSLEYDNIYFKPHPYSKNINRIYRKLKQKIKNLNIIFLNSYDLLSNPNIKAVVGINSSMLYESKYFYKKSYFLYKPYFDFLNNDIGIYGDYFQSSFWANILQKEDKNINLPFMKNRLRITLDDFWGYNEIDTQVIIKNIIRNKIKQFFYKFV